MLTKTDLTQFEKLIRKITREIVREEVENESQSIKDELSGDITRAMIKTVGEIRELKDRIKNLEIRVTKMHIDIKKEIRKFFDFHDEDINQLKKRLNEVENKVNEASIN